MALESATYVGGLNSANPAGTDPKSQGDDHIRLTKGALLNSLPGFTGVVIGTATESGTSNAYALTLSPAPASYTALASTLLLFKATHANTGAATLNVNSLGTKPIVAVDGSALESGDIENGAMVAVFYDGTSFCLVSANDRAARAGDTYTGDHDFTGAAVEVATPVGGDADTSAANTGWVDSYFGKKAGQAWTGTQDFTGATTKVATAPLGTNDTTAASTAFAQQLAFQAAVPAQTGNANKYLQTDGTNASWQFVAGPALMLFGDGSDGDVTITGTTTLARDMYYNNLTISGAGVLKTNGWRVFVLGTLDLTAAGAGAIQHDGGAGGAGANGTSGSGVSGGAAGAVSGTGTTTGLGAAGTAGGANGGSSGGASTAGVSGGNGGAGGSSGSAGAGNSGATTSGAATSGGPVTATALHFIQKSLTTTETGSTLIKGGASGASGPAGGGSGNATGSGGCGGGSGAGAGVLQLFARFIKRGAATAASAIRALGGAGGAGGDGWSGGSTGGGSGGAGGGGGWVDVVCEELLGSTAANAVDVTGGAGGKGGNGFGAGDGGGSSGGTGAGGRFTLAQLGAATYVDTLSSAAAKSPVAASGLTGGAAQTANTAQFSL